MNLRGTERSVSIICKQNERGGVIITFLDPQTAERNKTISVNRMFIEGKARKHYSWSTSCTQIIFTVCFLKTFNKHSWFELVGSTNC